MLIWIFPLCAWWCISYTTFWRSAGGQTATTFNLWLSEILAVKTPLVSICSSEYIFPIFLVQHCQLVVPPFKCYFPPSLPCRFLPFSLFGRCCNSLNFLVGDCFGINVVVLKSFCLVSKAAELVVGLLMGRPREGPCRCSRGSHSLWLS